FNSSHRLTTLSEMVFVYLDTNWKDSAIFILNNDNTWQSSSMILPLIVDYDETLFNAHIASLRTTATNFGDIGDLQMEDEINAVCNFYELIETAMNLDGTYHNLGSSELTALEVFAESEFSISVNARAILN